MFEILTQNIIKTLLVILKGINLFIKNLLIYPSQIPNIIAQQINKLIGIGSINIVLLTMFIPFLIPISALIFKALHTKLTYTKS